MGDMFNLDIMLSAIDAYRRSLLTANKDINLDEKSTELQSEFIKSERALL